MCALVTRSELLYVTNPSAILCSQCVPLFPTQLTPLQNQMFVACFTTCHEPLPRSPPSPGGDQGSQFLELMFVSQDSCVRTLDWRRLLCGCVSLGVALVLPVSTPLPRQATHLLDVLAGASVQRASRCVRRHIDAISSLETA